METAPKNQAAGPFPKPEAIAARAYQIYCERGREHGHDVDDWLQAEYELMQLPIRKLAELEPPRRGRGQRARKSVVALVHAALVAGSASLSDLMRWR